MREAEPGGEVDEERITKNQVMQVAAGKLWRVTSPRPGDRIDRRLIHGKIFFLIFNVTNVNEKSFTVLF